MVRVDREGQWESNDVTWSTGSMCTCGDGTPPCNSCRVSSCNVGKNGPDMSVVDPRPD